MLENTVSVAGMVDDILQSLRLLPLEAESSFPWSSCLERPSDPEFKLVFCTVTCCVNSRFVYFLINKKSVLFIQAIWLESMLFNGLLLQIGATEEKKDVSTLVLACVWVDGGSVRLSMFITAAFVPH